MGLSDIWHELQFFWIDVTNYTDAEKQVDKYEKIINKLDKKISSCEGVIEEENRVGTEINSQFQTNSNSAVGHMMDYFNDKQDKWNIGREELTDKMYTTLDTARQRRNEAQGQLTYWEGEVQAEETSLRNKLWNKKEDERKEGEKKK